MSDSLKRDEKISQGIRRLAKKQATGIAKHLKRKKISRGSDSVHEARKHLKKLRALLRLIRGEIGHKVYQRQNVVLRKIASALSNVRDSAVQLKTLAALRRNPKQLPEKKFDGLRQALLRTQARRLRTLKKSNILRRAKLQRLKREIERWKIKNLKAADLWRGLEKARRRFLDAHQQAGLEPNNENIHEWRKRTKDLLHQCWFLKNLSPKIFNRRIFVLKKLGELLGDAHDLAMLEATITRKKPHMFEGLLKLSRGRRIGLQKSAFALALKKSATDFPEVKNFRV
jgi:CHAD domain-containing protein